MKEKWIYPLILSLVCSVGLSSPGRTAEVTEGSTAVVWERRISLGYNASRGNTQSSQFSTALLARRERELLDELTLRVDAYYSSAEQETEAEKWYGLLRYGFSFGKAKKWDNFYRLEADHDRFANIEQRIILAGVVAYRFYDVPELKLRGEMALGSEHTEYGDESGQSEEAILVPALSLEKQLFSNCRVIQNLSLYHTLEDLGKYRLHSETVFQNSITEKLSLRLSLVDDYNSDPPQDTENNDLYFLSSLTYSF